MTLDEQVLRHLRSLTDETDEGDFLDNLIENFVTDAPALFTTLEAAVRDYKMDEASHVARRLKASACKLGANDLSRLCESIEAMSQSNNTRRAGEAFKELSMEYLSVSEKLLRDWRKAA